MEKYSGGKRELQCFLMGKHYKTVLYATGKPEQTGQNIRDTKVESAIEKGKQQKLCCILGKQQ